MENKITIISGFMSTGKDTLLNKMVNEQGYEACVSHTTRPMRVGETNGKEYFFVDKDKFYTMATKGEFVETRKYFTNVEVDGKSLRSLWMYGLGKAQLKSNGKPKVVILDKQGAVELIDYVGRENVHWVYLKCSEDELYKRAEKRGDYIEEVKRRIEDDKVKFEGIEELVDEVRFTDGN